MKNEHVVCSLMVGAILSMSACVAVNSSELASSTASDIVLEAHAYESNNSDRVTVEGQVETAKSHIKIEFDQGEELYVAKGAELDSLAWDDFSDSFAGDLFDGLDEEYIEKPEDGEKYYVKYRDAEGNETVISFERGFVTELTNPDQDDSVHDEIELRWDAEDGEMNGRLYASARYHSDNLSGSISKLIEENDGRFTLDISDTEGTGTVKLTHVTSYDDFEGFKTADVSVSTSSTPIDVTFPAPAPDVNRSLFKSANVEESADAIVQNKLESCLHECEEGETSVFIVAGEEYSCCENIE